LLKFSLLFLRLRFNQLN